MLRPTYARKDIHVYFTEKFAVCDFVLFGESYLCFSVWWSSWKILRELLTSVLRGPPKLVQTELGYEPYMLGKVLRSGFQRFLQFANPSSVEGDMLTLVSIGQKFRNSRQLFFFVSCRKGKAIPWTAFDTLKLWGYSPFEFGHNRASYCGYY